MRRQGTKYRIPFLVPWNIGDIIDFDDRTIVLVDVYQVLLECRTAVQPHNIAYDVMRRGEKGLDVSSKQK